VIACNFTPNRDAAIAWASSRGQWREVLNSNAAIYGGTDEGNMGGRHTDPIRLMGMTIRCCSTFRAGMVIFKQ